MTIMFPILQTKLFIPYIQSDLGSRPRLLAQLQTGPTKKRPFPYAKLTIQLSTVALVVARSPIHESRV